MGMFDSLYDADNVEWQTKAFQCLLDRYEIGDAIPSAPIDHQLEILGPWVEGKWNYRYATVRGGILVSLPDDRDETLPLLNYSSGWTPATKGTTNEPD